MLIVASLAVAVVAGVLAVQDWRENADERPRPTSPPGSQELIDVLDAIEAQDLAADSVPRGVASELLGVPGQGLEVEGNQAYVFVFPSVEARENRTDAAIAEPEAVLPQRTPFGTPIVTDEVHIATGSNIIVALVGGSPEVVEKVTRAVEGLA